jgi:hypothetical protein
VTAAVVIKSLYAEVGWSIEVRWAEGSDGTAVEVR